MKEMIKHVPVPIAGVALGLTALGNLIQQYSEFLRLMCGGAAAVLMILLFARMVMFYNDVKEEFKNPIIAGVSATVFMTMMQLSAYAYPYIGTAAKAVWFAAVAGHMILMVWYTVKFLFRFRLEEIYPTCFITYVGIVVASVTSAVFRQENLGEMIFWLGFAAYMVMLVLVTARYMKHQVPDSAKPLFCIYTAPMSLSLTGYLASVSGQSVLFIAALEIAAQLLFFVVLTQLPKLLRLKFYPSYAAFTFPFAITAFGLKKMITFLTVSGLEVPAFLHVVLAVETVAAVLMVSYTLVRYVMYLADCVKLDHPGPVMLSANENPE